LAAAHRSKTKNKRSRAGRPTGAELVRRKLRVIDTATNLFSRHGYAATSLVDVALKAGVATRTIYQHFGDKEDLFREVVFTPSNAPVLNPPRAAEAGSLFIAILRTAEYVIDVTMDEKTYGLMRLMVAEHNRFPDLTKKVVNLAFERFYETIERVFSDLCIMGLIPDVNHLESAKLFADIVLGAMPLNVFMQWTDQRPPEKELRLKVELFIKGRFGEKVAANAHAPKSTGLAGSRSTGLAVRPASNRS
jgi:TetR/AcrR family transcriptional regulator, mexJK operon transcriptional repressor